ncbi:MAG: PA-phosphatase [Mycobacterium sp.]
MITRTTDRMATTKLVRWWPLIAVLAMVALGIAVRRGSTPLDDWFLAMGRVHRQLYALLLFTNPWVLVLLLAGAGVVALYQRRWRLAGAMVVTPLAAFAAVRLLKPLFDREKEGSLAYPSGHVTVTVVVLGMIVLAVGARVWLLVAVTAYAILALLGQAFRFHYFTDTIGAIFLGTALVCLAAWAAGVDRCQPRCDVRHSNG